MPPLYLIKSEGAQHAAPLRRGQIYLRSVGSCHDCGEGFRIADGHIGQHFTVDLDICFFEQIDQLAIGNTIQAGGCVDAGNPQSAQIAAADAAVSVRVPETFQHRLIGSAEKLALRAALTFGQL